MSRARIKFYENRVVSEPLPEDPFDGRLFVRRGSGVGVVRASLCGAVPVVAVVATQAAVRPNVKNGEDKVQQTFLSGPGDIRTATVRTQRTGQLQENAPHPSTLEGGATSLTQNVPRIISESLATLLL